MGTNLLAMLAPYHNRFTALLPGPPGWAGARRELLDFMVQGEIYRGRHTDHPAGRHSIRTNQCPPPPSPHIFYGPDALPAAQPALKATNTFGLGRRGWSSPQRCYLHQLHTNAMHHIAVQGKSPCGAILNEISSYDTIQKHSGMYPCTT